MHDTRQSATRQHPAALFYLLTSDDQHSVQDVQEQLACYLAAQQWRTKRILIACADEAQALRLDETLWQHPAERFVPHNLAGEGPRQGAPVELAWPERRSNAPRDLLINLRSDFPDFATTFREVIDFVPYDAALKLLARERYKAYRRVGFHLSTATPPNAQPE